MNRIAPNEVLLTSGDIRRWQEEIRAWEAKKADADRRIAELRQKLDAAALISGTKFSAVPLPLFADSGEQEPLGDAAKRLLGAAQKPVMNSELQAELRKIERFREMLDKNNGAYYYTMINRLVRRGEVMKTASGRLRLVTKNETPSEGTPEGVSKAVEG
jgi:hypothetical protein